MSNSLPEVSIYTDGSVHPNPGRGGYGAVLIYKGKEKHIFAGNYPKTTNNRMEMKAVIESLKMLKEPCNVKLYTDSQYVIKMATNRDINKFVNNYKYLYSTINNDLIIELQKALIDHNVSFIWVKGHNNDYYNEIADQLAGKGLNVPDVIHDEIYELGTTLISEKYAPTRSGFWKKTKSLAYVSGNDKYLNYIRPNYGGWSCAAFTHQNKMLVDWVDGFATPIEAEEHLVNLTNKLDYGKIGNTGKSRRKKKGRTKRGNRAKAKTTKR